MKKFLVAMGLVAFAVVGCDDSSSASAGSNDEPGVESSSAAEHSSSSSSAQKNSSSSSSAKSSSSVASSSSGEQSSSSVAYVEPCRTDSVDTCEYGTLIDERDGQIYKTVKIGAQTWMAENLNYAYIGVPYSYTSISDSSSWCYKNNPERCTELGRLYTWAVAMDSVGMWSTNSKGCGFKKTCTPTYPVRGICPEGWHLPDTTEWNVLVSAVVPNRWLYTEGEMLKSQTGWNLGHGKIGSDSYSFSMLPAGARNTDGGYSDVGNSAFFWTSIEFDFNNFYAYHKSLDRNNDDVSQRVICYKTNGFSVRCVKD